MNRRARIHELQAENDRFADIVKNLLFPMFPGTVFDDPQDADPPTYSPNKLVRISGSPTKLKIKRKPPQKACINLIRSQPFSQSEKQFISHFLKNIDRIWNDWEKPYKNDTANSALSQIVAQSTSEESSHFLLILISKLTEWAQETYEGNKIAFSIGIDEDEEQIPRSISFDNIEDDDFLKVLTNGNDTLLVFGKGGILKCHETLLSENAAEVAEDIFNPVRFKPIGLWTATDNRFAITLTRNGEILIFKKGSLLFGKRRGQWRHFPHDNVITQMAKALSMNSPKALRKAVYLTALDVSFSRTGGCIGVLKARSKSRAIESLINHSDIIGGGVFAGKRSETLNQIIGNKRFQDLPRLLRQELVSIDGATILDHTGKILTAGAILKIPAGSSGGGGRQAATEALSQYGLGIKISNDGYIKFHYGDDEEPKIQLG